MHKIIVTDSGTDLNDNLIKSDIVNFVPFNLEVDGVTFVDTISLDKNSYLQKVEASKETPKTSAPSPQYYHDIFKNYEESFVVTITSKLSGSYNSAIAAMNMITEEFQDKKIHIFDSKTATAGQTLIVYKLKELVESGLKFEDIVEKLNEFIDSTKTYYFLQNFDNLVKTGRTNQYVASIAKLLNISIIGSADNGLIKLEHKIRGKSKAIAKLADMVTMSNIDFTDRVLSISHVDAIETALELKNSILEKCKFKDVIIQDTSGLCTNYAARNGIIIAF